MSTESATRDIGNSLIVGAGAAIHVSPIDLELDYQHIVDQQRETGGVESLSGMLCGMAGRLALCVDSRYWRARLASAEGSQWTGPIHGVHYGFTVGCSF